MSLFTELFSLTKARPFAMLVSSNRDTGLLTISVMPRASNENDGAYCKDLTLTATPEEFDTDFVAAIGTYRGKIVSLLEQAKEAGANIDSAAQKLKTATPTKRPGKPAASLAATTSGSTSRATAQAAQAYRAAADGDATGPDEEEPNNDWMKNRQPELF